MLTLNVITMDGERAINGSVNGTKFNVTYAEDLLNKLESYKSLIDSATTVEDYYKAIDDAKALIVEEMNSDGDMITQAIEELVLDSKTGKYYIADEDDVSKTPVPQKLVNVILESVEKDINPSPLIKAWVRFLRNPNFTVNKAELFVDYITAIIIDDKLVNELMEKEGLTQEKAEQRAMYNDVSITKEGLIVAKKYAALQNEGYVMDKETNKVKRAPIHGKADDTVDQLTGKVTAGEYIQPEFNEQLLFIPPMMGLGGDEFLCGDTAGHVIQIGKNHTLDSWDKVNTNDSTCCVPGLHVGGWQYVQAYEGNNCQLLECFVDPAEIGAVCGIGYGDGAMRVREYFVYGATEGRNKGIYHSSTYAAKKDDEWKEYIAEAIKNSNAAIAALGK